MLKPISPKGPPRCMKGQTPWDGVFLSREGHSLITRAGSRRPPCKKVVYNRRRRLFLSKASHAQALAGPMAPQHGTARIMACSASGMVRFLNQGRPVVARRCGEGRLTLRRRNALWKWKDFAGEGVWGREGWVGEFIHTNQHFPTAARDESLRRNRETESALPRSATHLQRGRQRLRWGPPRATQSR